MGFGAPRLVSLGRSPAPGVQRPPDRSPRPQDEELPHLTNPDADWHADALERLARAADAFSRTWAAEPRKQEGFASNNVAFAAQDVADTVKALSL